MSQTTRCPACQTLFKVVPDQLRIAEGWVRCGECGTVFNGPAHMLDSATGAEPAETLIRKPVTTPTSAEAEATPPQSSMPAEIGAEHAATDDAEDESSPPEDLSPDALDSITLRFAELERDLLENPPTPMLLAAGEPWLDESDPGPLSQPAPEAEPGLVPECEEDGPAGNTPSAQAPATRADTHEMADAGPAAEPRARSGPASAPAPDVPSFVAQARRRAIWESGRARGALWAALVLLLVGLAAQWALHERDWLAARNPQLKPLLQALCRPLGCRIEPYRLLDAIVIEGSSFNRVDPQRFRFSVTLHNEADLEVATPALELSLTDIAGQVLVRRVLQPDELAAPAALAARGEFDGSRTLTVSSAAQPHAIASYRVQAFYP